MGRQILVPIDGSENAWQALEFAFEHHEGDDITALYVIDPLLGDYDLEGPEDQPVKESEAVVEKARDRFRAADLDDTGFEARNRTGRPQDEILAVAKEDDVDQIVMGSRGLSGIRRLLLGSVAETVVRRSEQPVNIIR